MEALSVVVNSKLVADDVRQSTSGYDEVRRTAAEVARARRKRGPWSALRRSVTALVRRRSAKVESVAERPPAVTESSGERCHQF